MFFVVGEIVEGVAKGKVAHDVEGVVIEPFGRVDGGVGSLGQLGDELVRVLDDAVFVASEC